MYFIRVTSLVVFLYVLDLKPFTKYGCKSEVTSRVQDGEQIAWKLRKSTPSRQLSPVRGRQHLYYVVGHPVLECICELMLNWKRLKATVLLDGSISEFRNVEHVNDFVRSKFKDAKIFVDVVQISESSVTEIVAGISKRSSSILNVVILCRDNLTFEIINQVDNLKLFTHSAPTWIIWSIEWQEMFASVQIRPQSQVTIVSPYQPVQSKDEKLQLFDMFYSPLTNTTKAVIFAHWSLSERLQINEVFDPADRKSKLWGRNVLTIAFEEIPYANVAVTNENETVVSGYMIDLAEMLLSTLNMRQNFSYTTTTFGMGIGGNYTGAVGMIFRREADMCLNILAMTLSRIGGVRFVGCISKGYIGVIYNTPKANFPPFIYLMPFSIDVWSVAICLIVVLVAALALAWKAPWEALLSPHAAASRDISFGNFLISDPRGLTTRIIFSTLIVTVFLLTAFYNSFLTSCLTYQDVPVPFSNLDELADRSDYSVLLVKNSKYLELLQDSKEGVYAKIWVKAKKQPVEETFVQIVPDGYRKMYTGKYVLIAEGLSLMSKIANNCNVSMMSRKYGKEFFYLPVRHDFPYSQMIKMWMIRAWESGILHRLMKQYNLEGERHCRAESVSATLSLKQVEFVFALWACGVFLSLIILLVENANFVKVKRRYKI